MNITKKILVVLLSVTLLFCSLPIGAFAATENTTYYDGVWAYQIKDNYAILVGVSEVQNGAVCGPPSTLGGYPLKVISGINCGALAGIRTTQFIIPQGVEVITQQAFNTGLFTSIVIPKSLTTIAFNAFPNCWSFTTIYYEGTQSDWNKISISYPSLSNEPVLNATKYYGYVYENSENTNDSEDDNVNFLDKHLAFVQDEKIAAMLNQNSFSNVGETDWKKLAAYYGWDLLGDVGEFITFKFDDLTINADIYEMYLADMILALNNEETADRFEAKSAEIYKELYSGIKKLLQTDGEWENSVTTTMAEEIENLFTGKTYEVSEKTAKFLESNISSYYRTQPNQINSLFEGLSTASLVLDVVFASADFIYSFVDVYDAYVISKSFYEINDEFFEVCINAGNRLVATDETKSYGNWFLNAVYAAQNSEMANLTFIFDSAYKLTSSGTAFMYQVFIPKLVEEAVYPTISKLLGLASVSQVSTLVLAYNWTYGLLDAISGLGQQSTQYQIIYYVAPVEKELANIVNAKGNTLLSTQSESDAISYDMAYRILRQTNMYLYEAVYKNAASKFFKNKNDMTGATAYKNWWNQTMCHSGNYGGKYNIFSAHCPVDVYIYDSNGTLVASVINEKIEKYDARITMITGSGQKTLAYPSGEEFSFVIKARENGTMDYSFGTLNDTTIETQYISYDIPLEAEQEFSVSIPTSASSNSNNYKLNTNGTQVDFNYNSTTACESHTYGEWVADIDSATRLCTVCGYMDYKMVCSHNYETLEAYLTYPTCSTEGTTVMICCGCGENVGEGKALEPIGHTGGTADCNQKAICTVCGEEYGDFQHTYSDWVITKEATKTETGLKEKVCVCGHSVTEEIPQIISNGVVTPEQFVTNDEASQNAMNLVELFNFPITHKILLIIGASIINIILLVMICVTIKKKRS